MKNKIWVDVLFVLVGIVCLIVGILNQYELLSSIGFTIMGIFIDKFYFYLKEYNIKLFFQRIIYRNKNIRVSFAYLFRIKVDGKYFLIKGEKIKKFQPVGGVYQFYDSIDGNIKKIFSSDDEMKEGVLINQNDIRGYVKGKNLKKFINWFDSFKDREISCEREFREELKDIIDLEKFDTIKYRYLGSHRIGIFKSINYSYEYLIHDIYEVNLTDVQKKEFLKLENNSNSGKKYCFAGNEEIIKCYVKKDNDFTDNIANHTYKILEEKEYELQ